MPSSARNRVDGEEDYDETAATRPLPPGLPTSAVRGAATIVQQLKMVTISSLSRSPNRRGSRELSVRCQYLKKVLSGTVGSDDTGGTMRYDARELTSVRRGSRLREISCSGTTTTDTFPTMTKRQCRAFAMHARTGRRDAVSHGTQNGSLELSTMIDTGSRGTYSIPGTPASASIGSIPR